MESPCNYPACFACDLLLIQCRKTQVCLSSFAVIDPIWEDAGLGRQIAGVAVWQERSIRASTAVHVHTHWLSILEELSFCFVLLPVLCCQAVIVDSGPMHRPGAQLWSLVLFERWMSISVSHRRFGVRSCLVHFDRRVQCHGALWPQDADLKSVMLKHLVATFSCCWSRATKIKNLVTLGQIWSIPHLGRRTNTVFQRKTAIILHRAPK